MEENQLKLCEKQSDWHKDLKEQVFATNSDITVKRIGEKVQNMNVSSAKLMIRLFKISSFLCLLALTPRGAT